MSLNKALENQLSATHFWLKPLAGKTLRMRVKVHRIPLFFLNKKSTK